MNEQANIDRLVQMVQQLQEQLNRAIRAPDGDSAPSMLLSHASQRANTFPTFDSNGNLYLGVVLPSGVLSQANIGQFLYPQTAAEAKAEILPANYAYPPGNVLRYGANATPGTTDMTDAIQAAIRATSQVYVPPGTYRITRTIILLEHSQIFGGGIQSTILRNVSGNVTFQYLSPLDGQAPVVGLKFEEFQLFAKNGIQLNQQGNVARYGALFSSHATDVFKMQRSLQRPVFRRVALWGTYPDADDANKDTNIYPDTGTTSPPPGNTNPAELMAYGIGIMMAKCFDALIDESCYIEGYGIGAFLDGSDINNLKGRWQNNARHIHIFSHDTYGFSNKIEGRDILANRRRGGIFIDSTVATIIQNNYFETYLSLTSTPTKSPAGTYITTVNDQSTKILGNRFDQSRAGTPELDLSPSYGMLVFGNDATFDSVNPAVNAHFRSTYYYPAAAKSGGPGSNTFLAKWTGNSGSLTPPVFAHVELEWNNPRRFDFQNPKALSGENANSWPYQLNPTTGRMVLIPQRVSMTFNSSPTDVDLLVRIYGRSISGPGYVSVSWAGRGVLSTTCGFSATGEASALDLTIRVPPGVHGVQPILVEFADSSIEVEAIELIECNFQYGSGPPTAGSWRRSDRIINSAPTPGQPKAWTCSAAGSPGTWLSEGTF